MTTRAEIALSLKVQVAAAYQHYLDKLPKQATDYVPSTDILWATSRMQAVIEHANACAARGPVVRDVGAADMKRLWEMGLDKEIKAVEEAEPAP